MSSSPKSIPLNLYGLHSGEEILRNKALLLISKNELLRLHLEAVESAMDLADVFRQLNVDDENLKVIQILGMRTFNAFGASLKLALSGYSQNSALILRDVLETAFLLDYFGNNRGKIERWRFADKKMLQKEFAPVKIREALDARDGFTEKKRAALYEMFSELAGHATMKSAYMMQPQRGGNAVIGPFIEETSLEAIISEMGRLAIQVGEQINLFFPPNDFHGFSSRTAFAKVKQHWISVFYSATKP